MKKSVKTNRRSVMIEEIHKKLRENGLGRSNPEQGLAQVNEIHD